MPEAFVSQLLFLYRYIFVLTEVTLKVVRARDMRAFGNRGLGIRVFISLAGTLFIRTVEQAERVHRAMLSRGFQGRLHSLKPLSFRTADASFLSVIFSLLYFFRAYDIVGAIGRFSMKVF